MKIVHALAYYGDYKGGLQLYVQNLAKKQIVDGHEVKIITSNLYGNQQQVDGISITRVNALFSAFRVPFTPLMPFVLLREDCDVLHVHLPLPWLDISCIIKKIFHKNTKLIITLHNYLPTKSLLSKALAWVHNQILIKLVMQVSDIIVTTTGEFATSLPYRIPVDKHKIIPLGINTDLFKYINNNYHFDNNGILFVGRLIPEKGLDVLVNAMQLVVKEIPEAKLTAICSETYDYTKYQKEIEKRGKDFIKFKKNIPNEKMPEIYSKSAVLVMPSIDLDSFGFVLIESMACGCPVITSDLPGPSSIVNKETGLIVKKGNVNELHKAIVRVLRHNDFNRKVISINTINKYSWDNVYLKIMEIYS